MLNSSHPRISSFKFKSNRNCKDLERKTSKERTPLKDYIGAEGRVAEIGSLQKPQFFHLFNKGGRDLDYIPAPTKRSNQI